MIRGLWPMLWRTLRRPPIPLKLALMIVALLAYGASGFIYFERPGKPELGWVDGFWWAMVTMTTLGYGDFFPVTTAGRFLIGYPLMLLGMGMVGVGLGQLATFVVRADLLSRKGLMMSTLTGHVVVCNFSSRERFLELLREVRGQQSLRARPVVVIDAQIDTLPADIAEQDVHFIKGHPGRVETLRRANVGEASQAVVMAASPNEAASDDATTTICLALKSLYPKLHVVAECVEPENRETMARSGCDSIVCVMRLGPGLLAQELHDPGVVQVLQELIIWDEDINNIFIVPMTVGGQARTVADLRAWAQKNHATLLGVRGAERIELNPAGDRAVVDGEAAVVVTSARPDGIGL